MGFLASLTNGYSFFEAAVTRGLSVGAQDTGGGAGGGMRQYLA